MGLVLLHHDAGVLDFVPAMRLAYDYVPFPVFFSTVGYAMFAYLFGWTDANWLLRRQAKQFRFTPTVERYARHPIVSPNRNSPFRC